MFVIPISFATVAHIAVWGGTVVILLYAAWGALALLSRATRTRRGRRIVGIVTILMIAVPLTAGFIFHTILHH